MSSRQVPDARRVPTLQVALNGGTVTPGMPRTPEEIATEAAACVAAGATLLHLHAYDDDGTESLAEAPVTRAIEAVRVACPGVAMSMTTFAQIEPDPWRRFETISGWTVLPDLVPANQGEDGIEELTELLLARGVGVEACVFTVEDVETMLRRGGVDRFRRIVVEPMDPDPGPGVVQACELAARQAGLVLDPTYTGRALAGLRTAVERGEVRPGERTVFVHTGGLPGLFGHPAMVASQG